MLSKVGPTLRDEQMRKEGKRKGCLFKDNVFSSYREEMRER